MRLYITWFVCCFNSSRDYRTYLWDSVPLLISIDAYIHLANKVPIRFCCLRARFFPLMCAAADHSLQSGPSGTSKRDPLIHRTKYLGVVIGCKLKTGCQSLHPSTSNYSIQDLPLLLLLLLLLRGSSGRPLPSSRRPEILQRPAGWLAGCLLIRVELELRRPE
ncbi:hypothetical protein BDV19DRAFT_328824 [Aspergillus venezuelensis]